MIDNTSTIDNDLKDLDGLIQELESIKTRQKALVDKEALCKAEIQELMQNIGLEKESTKHGTVRLQKRADKKYNSDIKELEASLKEAKKLADDLGDFEITGYKESLVYLFAKEEELF